MRPPRFERHPGNPILRPGAPAWRAAATFNPGVVRAPDGRFLLYERAAPSLRPFACVIGAWESRDGVQFTRLAEEPVFTPAMAGGPHGSVQDPRVVWLGGRYLMTFAFRPYAWNCWPTGLGVPDAAQAEYPGFSGRDEDNQTRSGIAESADGIAWRFLAWVGDGTMDDRNVILFPEKIGGRYAALRRPAPFVSTLAAHAAAPAIRISYSDDLTSWTEPAVVIEPAFAWENNRIGGSTPPLRTPAGWLVFYHGVETTDLATRHVVYRMGAFVADLENPARVIARCPGFLMEPEAYYEKTGLFIPDVIFPTGAVVVDGMLRLYYGVCDTAIALAEAPLAEVVDHVLNEGGGA